MIAVNIIIVSWIVKIHRVDEVPIRIVANVATQAQLTIIIGAPALQPSRVNDGTRVKPADSDGGYKQIRAQVDKGQCVTKLADAGVSGYSVSQAQL